MFSQTRLWIYLEFQDALKSLKRVFTASPPKVQPRYDLDLDASYAKVT